MRATKIVHQNENRIKVDFPYNYVITERLKQIPDAKWSKTYNSWHIPYHKSAFDLLKNMFPDLEYINKNAELKSPIAVPATEIAVSNDSPKKKFAKHQGVSILVHGRSIAIRMPKNELDMHFILGLRYSRWDKKQYCWIVPNYPGNIDLLRDYFKDRITDIVIHQESETIITNDVRRKIDKDELLIIKTNAGRLKLFFGFNRDLTKIVRTIPYCNWNPQNKSWSIPFADKFLNEIKSIAALQNLKITYEEEVRDKSKVSRISKYDIPNYRTCPEEFILKLKELRYSERTILVYKNSFEEFVNYYHKFELEMIEEEMITDYLRYLVIERKISTSYQNQAINAIKFYFERVLGGQRKVYLIDRPREEKTLPIVLNEKEIADILKATENIKHKAILMLSYSAGLRLSELVNVKLTDIDSERMQIRIMQSKGKKDRYSILSPKLLELLRKYFLEYKPKVWLFEGQAGGQYAARSIQLIMKDSTRKAGVKKKVGVHSLRHSFATHLLEGGTDLRYIQSLLGHESSKTTEVYTHITTKGFDQIKSPVDKLDIF